MAEVVVPNEMAEVLGVTPLRLRNWLRSEKDAGHSLLVGHVHGARWEFSRVDADRLIAEFRASRGAADFDEKSCQRFGGTASSRGHHPRIACPTARRFVAP